MCLDPLVLVALGYRHAGDAVLDTRGELVRDTPHRKTWRTILDDGTVVFRKVRWRRADDARREWLALEALAGIGIEVPEPLLLARDGRRAAIVMRGCAGPSLLEWIVERGPDAAVTGYVLGPVVELVRRLHGAGFTHRDLYWNHILTPELDLIRPPVLLDVERVLRPWLRRRRWIEKDLAALLGSWPLRSTPSTLALRFLRAWSGGRLAAGWKGVARRVLRRAQAIRHHVPRHGSPPPWQRQPG